MVIKVSNLNKQFRLKQKRVGINGGILDLFKSEYRIVDAVKEINFEVESGEMLAFIGPNGAGKSTTIKMLTGILSPTSGESQVLGINPVRERRKLCYQIGTVYGQKSQLWFHLAPIQTFNLLAKIFEIDDHKFKQQLGRLIEVLQLKDYLYTPTRRLSLGQRMKCEIAASLLHRPKLIFLDEPTIGLDVLAKQQIREVLLEMNRSEGTTVLLTSHDTGDMEAICKRVIVVNDGTIMFDESIGLLKQKYMTHKHIHLSLAHPLEDFSVPPDVEMHRDDPYSYKIRVELGRHNIPDLMQFLTERYPIIDISINEPSMEEIIRKMYTEQAIEKEEKGRDQLVETAR